jgi:hypothetical protein
LKLRLSLALRASELLLGMTPGIHALRRYAAGYAGRAPPPANCLLFVVEAELPLALRASGLLFGMTPGIHACAATRPATPFAPLLRRSERSKRKGGRSRE